MDAFSYLSVLLSIILGLAITQVLQGYRALLLSRRRVRLYFPPLAWSALVILIAVQSWWSSFGLADRQEWNFATFAVILFQNILLYMIAALVLPDVPPEDVVDLEAHYYREATPFYACLLALVTTSLVKNLVLDNGLPAGEALFHVSFGGMAVISLLSRRPWLHHVLVALSALMILVYIALLFARL